MSRCHWRLAILVAIVIAGSAAGDFWYQHKSNDAVRCVEAARSALDRGDRHEADRLVNLLRQMGAEEHVYCLRGEMSLRAARALERRLVELTKWEQAARGCRILGDTVCLVG